MHFYPQIVSQNKCNILKWTSALFKFTTCLWKRACWFVVLSHKALMLRVYERRCINCHWRHVIGRETMWWQYSCDRGRGAAQRMSQTLTCSLSLLETPSRQVYNLFLNFSLYDFLSVWQVSCSCLIQIRSIWIISNLLDESYISKSDLLYNWVKRGIERCICMWQDISSFMPWGKHFICNEGHVELVLNECRNIF